MDPQLDVVLLRLARPVPDVLPVGEYEAGAACRLQVQLASGRQAPRGTVLPGGAASDLASSESAAGAPPRLLVGGNFGDLRGQSGAPVTLENPWGAVIGMLVAERSDATAATEIPVQVLEAVPLDAPAGCWPMWRHAGLSPMPA